MTQRTALIDEPYEIDLSCIKVEQPIGTFYVAAIDHKILRQITYYDVRAMVEREVDNYLGIQREVEPKRVRELHQYVNTIDACFPTSVILAIQPECAEFNEDRNVLTLRSYHDEAGKVIINRANIARVLDGQHRIEGLAGLKNGPFQINVSIFVDMDIAEQAYLFSVVNLAQTKVKKSLVYDLFDYSRSRSPQKSAHNIAVALDQIPESPFYKRIKRLGSATPGRKGETLTQATFVESVMAYISTNPVEDRDLFKRGKLPAKATSTESEKLIFRNLFLDEEDMKVADILMSYFSAASEKWPAAWSNPATGYILGKTNGYRSLMRLLRPAYLKCVKRIGDVPPKAAFAELFQRSSLVDEDFVSAKFLPGTGGEAHLFRTLQEQMFPNGIS